MKRWFLLLLFSAAPAFASDISGAARVIDGDTIEVATVRIRLWGIDAPETDSEEGRVAKAFLEGYLLGRHVRCAPRGTDRYQRTVAMCFVADTVDIAETLVIRGYARDWPKYSNGYYARKAPASSHRP